MAGTTVHLECRLARTPRAPVVARKLVRSGLSALGGKPGDDAVLLVSELVTDGVLKGGDDEGLDLRVRLDGEDLRVEVESGGGSLPPDRRGGRRTREGAYGLGVVERLSRRWGIESGRRTVVWAELRVPASPGRRTPQLPRAMR